MLKKKFSKWNIAIYILSFAVILLSARNIIVRDFSANGHGYFINNVIQILLMITFFLYGVKNYNLNRKLSYFYFVFSIGIGILVLFIIFLP